MPAESRSPTCWSRLETQERHRDLYLRVLGDRLPDDGPVRPDDPAEASNVASRTHRSAERKPKLGVLVLDEVVAEVDVREIRLGGRRDGSARRERRVPKMSTVKPFVLLRLNPV